MSKTRESTETKLVDKVTTLAIQTALEYLEQEKLKRQKNKRDRRLRNTKLLLKNYRSFKLHSEDLKIELKQDPSEMFETADDLALESIKRSKERTLAMVKFIDQMLLVYRILCEQSDRPERMRQYRTIEKMYVSEGNYTAEEIAECHKTNVRTVYRDINDASKTLSALMFGVDGIRFPD